MIFVLCMIPILFCILSLIVFLNLFILYVSSRHENIYENGYIYLFKGDSGSDLKRGLLTTPISTLPQKVQI